MVYQDLSDKNQSISEEFKYKVSLLDRFFSFLIDYLLLSPFVSFFLFLFFKDALRYWKQNPTAPEQAALTLLLGICYVIFFSLIQALFICIWRATPGQYFLKIKIVFENGEGLIFWRAFCRQIGFWASILFLGIPWMALMAHPQQKTFYDRIADCRVFSRKRIADFIGFEVEHRYWQSFMATLILFVGFILVAFLMGQFREIENRTESFKQQEKKELFCAELKGVNPSSRLELAIAMNLVGQLSDDCLDRESDFVLWTNKKKDLSLAYYAKSLTEEDRDTEKKYLAQACNEDSQALGCKISQAFQDSEFEKLYDDMKSQKSILAATLVYELSTILSHNQDTQWGFSRLAGFDSSKLMKKYILKEILVRKAQVDRIPASIEDIEAKTEMDERALQIIEEL